MSDRTARTVRAAYASSPWRVRLQMAGRWLTCPFAAIAAAVPEQGDILDDGCGHGHFTLYLALQHTGRRLVGVDIDERKLPEARAAGDALGIGDRVTFVGVPRRWDPASAGPVVAPANGWDAIVLVDVLYLIGLTGARAWVHAAAHALAPGGRLVVKELDTRPRWKHRVSHFQEQLATRVLRITRGDDLEEIPRADLEAFMRESGLEVEGTRLDRHRLHPHYLVVGTRPR